MSPPPARRAVDRNARVDEAEVALAGASELGMRPLGSAARAAWPRDRHPDVDDLDRVGEPRAVEALVLAGKALGDRLLIPIEPDGDLVRLADVAQAAAHAIDVRQPSPLAASAAGRAPPLRV